MENKLSDAAVYIIVGTNKKPAPFDSNGYGEIIKHHEPSQFGTKPSSTFSVIVYCGIDKIYFAYFIDFILY